MTDDRITALQDIVWQLQEHPADQGESFLAAASNLAAQIKGLADTERLVRALSDRVLAARSTPAADSQVTGSRLHTYTAGPANYCLAPVMVPTGAGTCGQAEGAPVHRVEQLTGPQRRILAMHAAGAPLRDWGAAITGRLLDLDLLDRSGPDGAHRITTRGLAWLEAHSVAEAGEPS